MEELNLWLYGIIKDVADGRVFPDHIPLQNNPSDDALYPAVRYLPIGGQVQSMNCEGNNYRPRYQIDIYANNPNQRQNLVNQIVALLDDYNGKFEAVPQRAPIFSFDFERRKYTATLDYLVF